MALVAFLVAAPFAFIAAYLDLKTMQLPHWLAPAAAAAFAVIIFIALPFDEAITRVIGAVFVLFVGFLLFVAKAMGGGDAKLASAFTLMIAPIDASFVLILLAVTSLVSMLAIGVMRRTSLASGAWEFWGRKGEFPYAVPLSATLMIYLALVAFLVN